MMGPSTNNAVSLGFGGVVAGANDHIAHFYRGEDQQLGVLGPDLAEGLRNGERCAVVGSPPLMERLRSWLRQQGIDAPAAEADGSLVVSNGQATAEDMRAMFERFDADTKDAGHPFLRLAGDGAWAIARDVSTTEMLRWEALYDQLSESWNILALCQFDLTQMGGDVVMNALRSHPYCVMGEAIVESPFHQDPAELLKELSVSD